jgi:AmmeMemoRadiSam system protein B
MRYPAVAGAFYTSSASQLRAEVKGYLAAAAKAVEAKERLAIICPHAGYAYSGRCAAYSYASCSNWRKPGLTAVIIGPNHTGAGTPVSVSFEDWKTPLGEIKCDVQLAEAIVKGSGIARRDELAHFSEHSSEVQVPFLQTVAPQARMVGICMGYQDIDSAVDLGKAIFAAIKSAKRNAIVIASSDFTHYEPAESAKKKDTPAIERLLALDEKGFEELAEARSLSICGHGPIAAAMHYAKLAGAKKCELLKYTNSGEATGDLGSVVSYASLAMGR